MNDYKPITSKVSVIGLGKSGVNTVNSMSELPESQWLRSIAVDSDSNVIERSVADVKIKAGFEWTDGQGCGGDIIKGERCLSRVRRALTDIIIDSSMVIVTGGMGGGTCTGGVPIIASIAKVNKVPALFVMSTPFSFEGHSKRKVADDGLKNLLPAADVLITIPNDLLYTTLDGNTPADDAFAKADSEVARAVLGISEIIRCNNLLAADFAGFKAVLGERKSTCSIGVGYAKGSESDSRQHLALERLVESPLLGGPVIIEEADAIILTITGGSDMQISEMKKGLETVEKYAKPNCRVIVGANTAPEYDQAIQITAVTIKYVDSVAEVENGSEKSYSKHNTGPVYKSRRKKQDIDETFQPEFTLQTVSRGIFLNTTPSLYKGEDLDVPTFQREQIIIDKGD